LQKSQGDLLYKSQEKGPDNELKSEWKKIPNVFSEKTWKMFFKNTSDDNTSSFFIHKLAFG
jgi:hypothetical protein